MIFNTTYTSPASPIYPSGDSTKYPTSNIPVGTIKLYSEQYISDIGEALQVVTKSTDKYDVQQMSQTILHHIPINGLYAIEFDLTFSDCTIT